MYAIRSYYDTEGWSRSVERRLDVLTSIYEMVKTDNAERRNNAAHQIEQVGARLRSMMLV